MRFHVVQMMGVGEKKRWGIRLPNRAGTTGSGVSAVIIIRIISRACGTAAFTVAITEVFILDLAQSLGGGFSIFLRCGWWSLIVLAGSQRAGGKDGAGNQDSGTVSHVGEGGMNHHMDRQCRRVTE